MKCEVCEKEIAYNENGTCEDCHQEILKRLEQKEKQRNQKILPHRIVFKVAGVTLKNEERKDIQKEIKKILNEYKKNEYFYNGLYGGYTNSEIKEMDLNVSEYEGYNFSAKLVGDEYNGEDCFKIYFKTYNDEYVHIGYAPKNFVNELKDWITEEGIKVKGVLSVIGGKYKHCELYEEDYEEKERVIIEELTYGIEIELVFYDSNIISNNKKIYDEGLRKTEQQLNIEHIIGAIVWMIFIGISLFTLVKIYSFINWLFN